MTTKMTAKITTKKSDLASLLLRISIAAVFFYFGTYQVLMPHIWIDYLPQFILSASLPLSFASIIMANGILEITLGVFLLLGLYTSIVSLILGIHLMGIAISLGFTPTGIRDFGLSAATISIFFSGPGHYSLDRKLLDRKSLRGKILR